MNRPVGSEPHGPQRPAHPEPVDRAPGEEERPLPSDESPSPVGETAGDRDVLPENLDALHESTVRGGRGAVYPPVSAAWSDTPAAGSDAATKTTSGPLTATKAWSSPE